VCRVSAMPRRLMNRKLWQGWSGCWSVCSRMAEAMRILHAHSGFNLGGKEARAVRLMNLWGPRARHVILNAQPDATSARAAIDPTVAVHFPEDAPSLQGLPAPGRYWRLAKYMQSFDLVLSYNWGSMDIVMAHRMFSLFMRLPPLIHHEDGFNEDETQRLNPKRNLFRRAALPRAHALVVPSTVLEQIALTSWHQPPSRIRRIPNGIALADYGGAPDDTAIPGFVRSPGKAVAGTLAGLREVKNIPRLLRAAAPLKDRLQLVIVGEGDQRQKIEALARSLGLDDICLPGFLPDPARIAGCFDIFALSSDSEQFPISLVEAMAAGIPAVSTAVGDVAAMVADENLPFIVPVEDEAAFTAALAHLADNPQLRAAIGAANRHRAFADFAEEAMVERYATLYEDAVKRRFSLR
jgi:L-malate glycosyltransferase